MEDNYGDVLLVREALHEHGLGRELIIARDGAKAIETIERIDADADAACPALLILDLNLPRRSGLEVLQHMRRSQRCAGVPVVILSSSDAPNDRAAAMELGANQYIRKPSNLDGFLAIGGLLRGILLGGRA